MLLSRTSACVHNHKCDFNFIQQFNRQEINILDTILSLVFSVSPTKICWNKAGSEHVWVSKKNRGVLFLNKYVFERIIWGSDSMIHS